MSSPHAFDTTGLSQEIFGHPLDAPTLNVLNQAEDSLDLTKDVFTKSELLQYTEQCKLDVFHKLGKYAAFVIEKNAENFEFFRKLYGDAEENQSRLTGECIELEEKNQCLQIEIDTLEKKNGELIKNHMENARRNRLIVTDYEQRLEYSRLRVLESEDEARHLRQQLAHMQSNADGLKTELRAAQTDARRIEMTLDQVSQCVTTTSWLVSQCKLLARGVDIPAERLVVRPDPRLLPPAPAQLGVCAETQTDDAALSSHLEARINEIREELVVTKKIYDMELLIIDENYDKLLAKEKAKCAAGLVEEKRRLESRLEAETDKFESRLAAETATFESMFAEERTRHAHKVVELQSQIVEETRQTRIYKSDVDRLIGEKELAKRAYAHLEDKNKTQRAEILKIKAEYGALQSKCEQLQCKAESFFEVQREYEATKDELEKAQTQLEAVRNELSEEQDLVKDMEIEIASLQEQCDEYQITSCELRDQDDARAPGAVAELHAARLAFKELSAQIEVLTAENTTLRGELDGLKSRHRVVSNELTQASKILQGITMPQREMIEKYETVSKNLEVYKKNIVILRGTIDRLHKENQELHSKNRDLQTSIVVNGTAVACAVNKESGLQLDYLHVDVGSFIESGKPAKTGKPARGSR